jgi:hypothetical protein
MLITPRKGKIITDRRIVDPIFMFVGAGGFWPPSTKLPKGTGHLKDESPF